MKIALPGIKEGIHKVMIKVEDEDGHAVTVTFGRVEGFDISYILQRPDEPPSCDFTASGHATPDADGAVYGVDYMSGFGLNTIQVLY